jgi:hypothetical protein
LKSNSFYENYRKKTPEALECTHILGTTAEQVVVKWSNARPGGINFRQMPAYTEVIVSQMPGGEMIAVGFDSYIIHEENTKEITTVSVVLYVIKNHVNLHKL